MAEGQAGGQVREHSLVFPDTHPTETRTLDVNTQVMFGWWRSTFAELLQNIPLDHIRSKLRQDLRVGCVCLTPCSHDACPLERRHSNTLTGRLHKALTLAGGVALRGVGISVVQ